MYRRTFMTVLITAFLMGGAIAAAAVIPEDADSDGIANASDRCPQTRGSEQHYGCAKPVAVGSKVTRPIPFRRSVNTKWDPWATPSVAQVHIILDAEQEKWGGPHLGNRVACESGYSWAASNGQYAGLLQFGSIWGSMWAGTPRKVTLKMKQHPKRAVQRWTQWSDGKWTPRTIRKVRVTRVKVLKGKLPRYPDAYHAWAAIRVGQRAVSGHGPTTSWACGL
jgi:hypothetical protein